MSKNEKKSYLVTLNFVPNSTLNYILSRNVVQTGFPIYSAGPLFAYSKSCWPFFLESTLNQFKNMKVLNGCTFHSKNVLTVTSVPPVHHHFFAS